MRDQPTLEFAEDAPVGVRRALRRGRDHGTASARIDAVQFPRRVEDDVLRL